MVALGTEGEVRLWRSCNRAKELAEEVVKLNDPLGMFQIQTRFVALYLQSKQVLDVGCIMNKHRLTRKFPW
jgi:hypothetical protein